MSSAGDQALTSSLTDMMTSLMVIFILLLVVYLNQAQSKREEESKILSDTKDDIRSELEDLLVHSFDGVMVKQDEKDPLMLIVVVPGDRIAFGPDEYELNRGAQEFLASFGPRLARVICDPRFNPYINSVVVEGHTDSTAPRGEDAEEYNLELSQKRSLYVMLEMFMTAEQHRQCLLLLGSASGRGMTDLVRDYSGQEDRERSRRVEFKVRLKSKIQPEVIQRLHSSEEGFRIEAKDQ